jgi:zinc protease
MSGYRRIPISVAAVALVLSIPLRAADTAIKFTDVKLKNGLRVIVSEDHSAPTFSIAVTYNVGSADEKARRTGFAHLFEHMMFKGSENVGPGEHFTLVFNNGGNMNGTTNQDRTLYFETLPANQLEMALFLESDRMKSLDITKANLDKPAQCRPGRAAPWSRQSALRQDLRADRRAGLRQSRVQAFRHRLDGGSQRGLGG